MPKRAKHWKLSVLVDAGEMVPIHHGNQLFHFLVGAFRRIAALNGLRVMGHSIEVHDA